MPIILKMIVTLCALKKRITTTSNFIIYGIKQDL